MRVDLTKRGLFVVFRAGAAGRDAIGFVVKPVSAMLFSDRHNGWKRSVKIGPLFVRTYARKPIIYLAHKEASDE